jgi:4-amino-4-deoxy-L-arabinose transferase-like glycosyltransferase
MTQTDHVPSRARQASRAALLGGWIALLAFSYPLFYHSLAKRDLWSSHEGRAAQDAQSILDDGCWGLPRLFDLRPEMQKPPLYYWWVAAIAWLRGTRVDAWAVRLPAATAALGTMLVLYGFGIRRGRPLAGWLAAMIAATAVHFTWLARVGRIDMPLTLTTTLSLVGFYFLRQPTVRAESQGARWPFLIAYGCIALGILLKGPIAIVLVGAALALQLLCEGRLPRSWRMKAWRPLAVNLRLWPGLALAAALVAPWFFWAGMQTHGMLFQTFLWYHNIERAFGGAEALRAHPWWFYVPRFCADFLPWSPLLVIAGWCFWRQKELRDDREVRFGLAWMFAIVLILSCARFKRADYLLPAYPGAALVLGCLIERWHQRRALKRQSVPVFAACLIVCVAGWCVYVDGILPQEEPALEQKRFAEEIRRLAPAPQLVLFFRAESHALAFHVGSPIDTFLEWENLDIWAGRPGCYYIVMPPECAAEWPEHVRSGKLIEVVRNTDMPGAGRHERPLVLVRTCPPPPGPRDRRSEV